MIQIKDPSTSVVDVTHLFQDKMDSAPVIIPIKAVRELPRKPKIGRIKGETVIDSLQVIELNINFN